MELELSINGVIASLDIAPNESLLTLLRREGYCGVKHGCETGECGACTVLVDGVPRPSCVMLAAQAGGCSLSTVDSLGSANRLHPLQTAFIEVGAVQCGFCTPGMLLSASALLDKNPSPTESEVRDALSGNLCRCSGYEKPVQAVLRAAALMRGETVAPLEYHTIDAEVPGIGTSKTPAVGRNGRTGSGERTQVGGTGGAVLTAKIPALTASGLAGARLNAPLQVVGHSVPAIHAPRLATGKSSFASDLQPRGMLYARLLTSPHAHAIIRNIEVSQARSLPGVHAVLTYKDVPRVPYSSVERPLTEAALKDQYCLDSVVRYVGDRVAVVAAETPEVAAEALGLIEVEYEELPALLDPRQTLENGAPAVHTETDAQGIFDAPHNIAARVRSERGDVESAFAAADLVVEGEYLVPPIQQAPIETHTTLTYFDEDEYLVVRTSTQVPHYVRRVLARVLGLPARRIRVVRPEVGGDFGVKQEIVLEDLAALLTLATNRPILLEYTRAQEFHSSRVRQQAILRLKTGVKRNGTIIANQMAVLASTGAYATHSLVTPGNAAASALALYPCANMRYVAEIVYTNQPPATASRSASLAQEFFALESHMDEVARQLGIEVLELRRKNWIKVGEEYPFARDPGKGNEAAPVIESSGLPQCLRVVEEKIKWEERHRFISDGRIYRGAGVALSMHGNPYARSATSGAMIKLNEDGSFDVFVGANESEPGSDTMIAQIAAETLSVPLDDVLLHTSDATAVPFETGVGASSSLYISAGAVKKAAEQARRQMLSVAGRILNVLPEALKIANGIITAPNGDSITVPEVAAYSLHVEGRHIMSTASWKVQQVPITFAAQGVEIEVDTETGSIRILNAVTAVDVGRALNPMILEAQIQGGAAQSLGSGICEELIYDQKGNPLTTSLRDYHLYTATDIPTMQTYLVETGDPSGPFGAKAVGEIPLYGMAPAIANAVTDALGIRLRQIPLTPERMLRAIHAHNARSS